MPLVRILVDIGKVHPESQTVADLSKLVRNLIASALDCDNPDGKLKPTDIEVEVGQFAPGLLPEQEHKAYTIGFIIEANDYPERRQNLKERAQEIARGLEFLKPKHRAFVWVRLLPAEFVDV